MKTIKLFSFILLSCCITATSFAQKAKSETFKVSGECGMCKAKIEKAAMNAGATYALWDVDTKMLTVKYNSNNTNAAKIQETVAGSGYDTKDIKATKEAYNKLPGCCKYERSADALECCKDGKCTKEGHDGKDCCKKTDVSKMDCYKDGKCTKEGHEGKECCKKS